MKKWGSSAPESQIVPISDANYASGFYYLGNKYKTKVEHIGIDNGIAADEVLIL